ncbi:Metal-binding regulatory protein cuf1 [Sphaceloma murrayae]|uniref:Metal-binding regulatory protein cuf1 n=1 Tax=Sphaceloma murrayae TaxID=2082308 RepID=A0A2K1R214_9PEZI|nr:Metal-binding regulatory protein cuf1 [Sphaceloma murrayae]
MDRKASTNPFEALSEQTDEDLETQQHQSDLTAHTSPEKKDALKLVSEEQLKTQKYAAEKLRRQTERIKESEAALEEVMRSKAAGRSSRANKWKPFDYREIREESPFRDDDTSARSTPTPFNVEAKVFQPKPIHRHLADPSFAHLTGGKARPLGTHGDETQWTAAARSKVTSTTPYFTRSENQSPMIATSQNKREVNEVFGNDLPSPSYCSSHPGTQDGQIQFCMHPNGDVSAQQWSSNHYQWVNIGQYSATRRRTEGQLASSRIKGESEVLSLQQHTLAYFHALAKQREAAVVGKEFGMKDVQACMPNLILRPHSGDEASESMVNIPTAPAAHLKTITNTAVALPKRTTPASKSAAVADHLATDTGHFTTGSEYLKSLLRTQGKFENLSFGSMSSPATSGLNLQSYHSLGAVANPFVTLPKHVSGMTQQVFPDSASFTLPSESSELTSGAQTLDDSSRRSTYSTHMPSTVAPGDILYEIGATTRSAAHESLQSLPMLSKASGTSLSDGAHITSDAETLAYQQYVLHQVQLQAYQNMQHRQAQESQSFSKTPGRPPVVRESRREISTSSIHELGETEPDHHQVPAQYQCSPFLPQDNSSLHDPPTPQHLDDQTMHNAHGATYQYPGLSDYDRNLKTWFFNPIKTERQEAAYKTYMSVPDTTPTHRPKSRTANPGVIGPPSSAAKIAKDASSSPLPSRRDSTRDSTLPTPAKERVDVERQKEETTRLLIPMIENLRDYTEGPLCGRRGYWAPFAPAPEWAVDKGMRGNGSFFEDDWGRVPERIGRDWRYRDLGWEASGGRYR